MIFQFGIWFFYLQTIEHIAGFFLLCYTDPGFNCRTITPDVSFSITTKQL